MDIKERNVNLNKVEELTYRSKSSLDIGKNVTYREAVSSSRMNGRLKRVKLSVTNLLKPME